MNANKRGVILLLKSAIRGKKYELPEEFDIEEGYELIKKQGLITMGYLGAALCGIDRKLPVMREMLGFYAMDMLLSEGQVTDVGRIYEAFQREGIDFMPLKGCNMKALYPKPELRLMGDADILIKPEQYEKIKPIMRSLGFKEEYESDHELVWSSPKIVVELHKRLIPSYNKDYYAYYGDGWRLAKHSEGSCWYMDREDEFIYLFVHFAKHYRDGGIGCRPIIDLWVWLRTYPDMNMKYIEGEIKKLQLSEFYENIRHLINVWFNEAETDEKTEFISEFILSGGLWGIAKYHLLSEGVKKAQTAGSVVKGLFKRYIRLIFPPVNALKGRYGILEKLPVLLPFVWVWRWIAVLLFRRNHLKDQLHCAAALNVENIKDYEQSLAYVGLAFNFKE